ncbi:T9SS type A sorting domain-containing protein [Chryseobacterium sp. Leaf394]|uniref:T9SS type A sorting domain-containing protein n=1 Tax=Chryseobacterium sp. Leaf394 TaxID=1736361 RepID=UPI0006FD3585|nr:T9SS type A sorting domain-containing protein [Chryseobacterium sp. Leaf394]KQS92731.1 hypothetical protein ASG21_09920 [Chryseobacterium sp. Leaf394]
MKKILFSGFLALSLGLSAQTYCGPLTFGYIDPDDPFWNENGDEPITLVNFAGINNTTDDEEYVGTFHQMFLSQTANVAREGSYNITLKGNTAGNYTNLFVVFIDWNQNGVLNDAGEVYEIAQTITNSTGLDSEQAVHSITVPATAALGNTRMRVKKLYDDDDAIDDLLNPCIGGMFGQAEDYTVSVSAAALSVTDIAKSKSDFKLYPNPVSQYLNYEFSVKIKSITVSDQNGRIVLRQLPDGQKGSIDLSTLTAGVYIVQAQTENGIVTEKIIKK